MTVGSGYWENSLKGWSKMFEGRRLTLVDLVRSGEGLWPRRLRAVSRMALAAVPLMIAVAISPVLDRSGSASDRGVHSAAWPGSGVSALAPEATTPECFLCRHDKDGSNVSKRHRTGRH